MKRLNVFFPPVYVVMDAALLRTTEMRFAEMMAVAGIRLLQYRNKQIPPRDLLSKCRALSELLHSHAVRFAVNDRADIALLAQSDAVHLGQQDVAVEDARALCGGTVTIGVSTHTEVQVAKAAQSTADYVAIGPIYATRTKAGAEPVVGPAFIRWARRETNKPLVAIGGISLERAEEVFEAGADSVAVAGDLLSSPDPGARAAAYVELTGHLGSV